MNICCYFLFKSKKKKKNLFISSTLGDLPTCESSRGTYSMSMYGVVKNILLMDTCIPFSLLHLLHVIALSFDTLQFVFYWSQRVMLNATVCVVYEKYYNYTRKSTGAIYMYILCQHYF